MLIAGWHSREIRAKSHGEETLRWHVLPSDSYPFAHVASVLHHRILPSPSRAFSLGEPQNFAEGAKLCATELVRRDRSHAQKNERGAPAKAHRRKPVPRKTGRSMRGDREPNSRGLEPPRMMRGMVPFVHQGKRDDIEGSERTDTALGSKEMERSADQGADFRPHIGQFCRGHGALSLRAPLSPVEALELV